LQANAAANWSACALEVIGPQNWTSRTSARSRPAATAFALGGWRFALAVAVSFVLGALMCIGIGNYGPIRDHALPVGHASAGGVSDHDGERRHLCSRWRASVSFRSGRFAHGPSLGLIIGGVVGVLIAFYIVNNCRSRRCAGW